MGTYSLLHVEDEDASAVLLRLALDAAKIDISVYRVSDGDEALKFLSRTEPYAEARQPDVIFLDLNIPRMDGWQLLGEITADESLRSIPIVVLSTTSRPADKARALTLGARHYLTKPLVFEGWITEVELACKKLLPLNGRVVPGGNGLS